MRRSLRFVYGDGVCADLRIAVEIPGSVTPTKAWGIPEQTYISSRG